MDDPQGIAGERERLMAEFSITLSGQQYAYSHYLYDRLDDALAYARKQRIAPSASDAADSLPSPRVVKPPDELERRRMAGHWITFTDGAYRLGPYKYDRLEDAMRYARLKGVTKPVAGAQTVFPWNRSNPAQ